MASSNTTCVSLQFRGRSKEKIKRTFTSWKPLGKCGAKCPVGFPWGRLLTVLVYVACVSVSAIILGVYYYFLWHPVPKIVTFREGETISENTGFVRSVRRG